MEKRYMQVCETASCKDSFFWARQDLLLITSAGIIIRTPVESISQLGRITSGVKLISLDEGVSIVSAALAKREDEAPEQNEDA